MKKKTVLVIDPSAAMSELFAKMIDKIDGFEVCAVTKDAYSAVTAVNSSKPDLILLGSELEGGGRVKFLMRLLPQYPVPVIAVTNDHSLAAKLLAAGAADILPKPAANDLSGFRAKLTSALKNAANLRQIRCGGVVYQLRRANIPVKNDKRLILIGGSTGSTEALPLLLKGLAGADLPPIAAVLHMPGGYTAMYAARLSKEPYIEADEARDGMKLRRGHVMVAQGAKHFRIASDGGNYLARVSGGERISGHCPSVDALFMSAAELDAKRMIAVLLTGMGSDGARGMLKLHKAGAYTIGQDEKSSVVYGMPKAAFELGAVDKQCPLDRIAAEIIKKLTEWK